MLLLLWEKELERDKTARTSVCLPLGSLEDEMITIGVMVYEIYGQNAHATQVLQLRGCRTKN